MSQYIERGIISTIFSSSEYLASDKPLVFQVQSVKLVEGRRCRILLSDGLYSCQAVTRADETGELKPITKFDIIRATKYEIELVGGSSKHVLLVADYEILDHSDGIFGDEKALSIDTYLRENPSLDILMNHKAEAEQERKIDTSVAAPQFGQPQPPSHAAAAAGAVAAPFQQPQQIRGTGKKVNNLCLIEQLSPYQNVWTLKARVSHKGDLRTWTNAKGSGKLFNVNFLDESGEIRATAFNDNAEKFHQLLQENKVYYVSKARIQNAKKQFSNLANPYELQLDKDSDIYEAEDSGSVPSLKYDFVKLNKIQELESDSIIDIVGVIKEVNEPFQITSRAGKAYDRRDILVVDDSQFAISVGLWNNSALNFDIPEGSVVAIKGCKVSDFNGKTLSLTSSAVITQNPEVNEAYTIKGWYDAQGRREQFKSLKTEPGARKSSPGDRKKIAEIIALETQISEKPDYHSVKATVNYVRSENFAYAACSTEGCSKKVTDQGDGTWRCEKCDINHAQPKYRYILSLSVVDETGNLWLTLFDEQAQTLLGISANELMELKENGSPEVASHFENLQSNEFEFRIRGRLDSYNGTERVRYNAYAANKIDFSAESSYLVEKFEKMGL
ncbi:hypothetical protein WICPIJ_000823 [Wickerhamomyces pijperi]|uniref:Replication protein A subunit n=1 Tax=Wickerhamomyces pijperi TaxID=599730 RepID=A0A9P8QCZ9_WICPI|nr:hypothetical protein WICPIJ_000823 [Wickerhamomyces pijperi]